MANTLITREDIGALTESEPAFTDGQLDVAVSIARTYCRWHIAPTLTQTLTLDGRGGRLLALPSLHVVDVTAVTVDGVEVTDFEWSDNGTLERCAGWPAKRRSIEVTLEHGHAACPDDVAGVVASIAAKLPLTTGGEGVEVGVVEEAIGTYRYRLSDSSQTEGQLNESHMFLLSAYRLP